MTTEELEKLTAKYRLTFIESEIGTNVLIDILDACHFGCTLDPDNKVQVAEYNVGTVILAKCGIYGPGKSKEAIKSMLGLRF